VLRRVEFENWCLVVPVSFSVYKSGANGNQTKDDVLSLMRWAFSFLISIFKTIKKDSININHLKGLDACSSSLIKKNSTGY